jgi:putative SOS response-associated peptidase YedK
MCNRVTLREPPHDIARILELFNIPPIAARFNIAPTEDLLIFRRSGDAHEASFAHWGLQPNWMKDASSAAMFNARAETADSKPAFKQAFRERRCLIPVDGFYEWEAVGKRKMPHHFTLKSAKPFALAGLYEISAEAKPNEPPFSCTILTTESNAMLHPLNDRMPVILEPEMFRPWLDPAMTDVEKLKAMIHTYPQEKMASRAVNPYVNKSGNEGPQCLNAPPAEPPRMTQGTLFD